MTTLKEYEEKKQFFDYEIEKLSDYLKVDVNVNIDAMGKETMCFWLKKKNGRCINCVFDLMDLETIRIVLEELDKVE